MKHILPVIDCEASGLSDQSYPIQVGIVLDDNRQKQWLVRPEPHWTFWDNDAQNVHGYSREFIIENGKSASVVAQEINEFAGKRYLFSDAPRYELFWLKRLFFETGVDPQISIESIDNYIHAVEYDHRERNKISALDQDKELIHANPEDLMKQFFEETGLSQHDALYDAQAIQWAVQVYCEQLN